MDSVCEIEKWGRRITSVSDWLHTCKTVTCAWLGRVAWQERVSLCDYERAVTMVAVAVVNKNGLRSLRWHKMEGQLIKQEGSFSSSSTTFKQPSYAQTCAILTDAMILGTSDEIFCRWNSKVAVFFLFSELLFPFFPFCTCNFYPKLSAHQK